MKNNAIRQAIEHHVDGLRMPEEAMHAILQKAKEDCPVKRKTSLMLVAVIVLLLGAATALAVTALHDRRATAVLWRWRFAHGLAAGERDASGVEFRQIMA